jgi:ketosteroid isomerase-like protein
MKFVTLSNVFFTICVAACVGPCRAEAPITPAQVDHAFAVYGKAWGEPDAGKRAAYLAEAWAKDGQFKDPSVVLTGAEALSRHIGGFLQQFPAAKLTMTSRTDSYGGTFRADWLLDFGDGKSPVLEGFDFGELDSDGRIVKIAGFFGPLHKEETVKNEAIIAKYLESLFTKFDYAGLDSVLAADVVYTQAVGLPYGGTYHGLPDMMKMFIKSSECSSMIVVDGPTLSTNQTTKKIVASFTVRSTAKKSGKVLDMAIQESFEVKGGKIVGITPFYFDTKTFVEFLNAEAIKPSAAL